MAYKVKMIKYLLVKKLSIFTAILLVIVFVCVFFWFRLFGAVGSSVDSEIFVIPEASVGFDISQSLYKKGFIKNASAFQFLMDNFGSVISVEPGGYKLSKNMNSWQVIKKLESKKDLVWVTISFCARKEQVGEILAEKLGWDSSKLERWNLLYKDTDTQYYEGIYYPDTYLIPLDETEEQIARRFINRFNEKTAPLSDKFLEKNIKWTTGVKIASLIAREAGGVSDMGIISGVIWNRLDQDMALQIDATMQYTLARNENGSWWGNIDLDEKKNDSPYNSYLYKGLPPTPICSPDIHAIEAVLNPEDTDCLFYLHDKSKTIHCAATYKEHLANIEKYLR